MNDSDHDIHDRQHRAVLAKIARRAMLERGLPPDFPPGALLELDGLKGPATAVENIVRVELVSVDVERGCIDFRRVG